jgi:hypothetical protein
MDITSQHKIEQHAHSCGVPPNNASSLAQKTIQAIREYQKNQQSGVYDTQGKIQNSILYGASLRSDRSQNRIVQKTYPKRKSGRPKRDDIRILVSFLATAFASVTNKPVTLNQEGALPLSPFHSFIEPIFDELKLSNLRDYIADHMSARKNY